MSETMYFKCETLEDAQALEDIFYSEFVSEDGINFKFPFQAGTLQYIDPAKYERAFVYDERIAALALTNPTVAAGTSNQKNKADSITAGWLPEPINL